MITFDLITIFPKAFDSYLAESIIKRAQQKKLIKIKIHNLRDYTMDKHKKVDDRPYGGGPGMILMVESISKALRALKSKIKNQKSKIRIIMLTPAGKKFTQREVERLAKYNQLILLCGRYEGFDARVDKLVDEKISIGDYVLSGGELPAMVVVEAVARQIPGVVGHKDALSEETFAKGLDYVEYPQYTRPEKFKVKSQKSKVKIMEVPKVLLSGNHKEIKKWRERQSKKRK
ncbi:MAG: tRNA (guanosine(37)-N1)-methyltransferase TrmD [Candidatus Buchananbacteria bacterium RIFCSPHIGHO2_01_FULL_39_14]|uniref:tRNA (guanine-N(1)-)-methyltransferase n=2 Tax=Candidatus Buchananiibacteriota TaxID=1817903 RepID=A0A1G1YU43_9BACT|nr:MAG: tRNA (guanosine(37)-N1)-methyltransferase TrmD [Candidatus Buchananbacteria bacterium RIFCSPHIGHO2_01_FULL_39_14]OGY49130.1 MAG: tRNA (guanosine(37)-N1)-methyltransferase TrmD [Candidatus Buchananbacteria bacterium RIFCSPHIGHO2_02_FULL_39_17]OGY55100.1 MAG: tRNA (guanosine(37)-N1)-methyltransferase TrmD [Candidatus Buchananbacteria bacterium RIFCSPLOWO2_01_FULL_40_23b]